MERAPEQFSLADAMEKALDGVTISQRKLLESRDMAGFFFNAKGVTQGNKQWLGGLSEYLHKVAGADPEKMKRIVQDYLEREVKALQRQLSSITDAGEQKKESEALEAKERFLEKLIGIVGGQKKNEEVNSPKSLNKIFSKEAIKANINGVIRNIWNQVKWVMGGGLIGMENSLTKDWDEFAAKRDARREANAKATIHRIDQQIRKEKSADPPLDMAA